MASPFAISTPASPTAPNATGIQAPAATTDGFAALLDGMDQSTSLPTITGETSAALNLGNAINLSLGFVAPPVAAEGEAQIAALPFTETQTEIEIDPVAVPVDAPMTLAPQLADLVKDLTTLRDQIASGKPVDDELLEKIDASLDDLADQLGIELDAVPSQRDFDALLQAIVPGDESIATQLTSAFAPLIKTLGAEPSATAAEAGVTPFPAEAKPIADKLAALLVALDRTPAVAEQLDVAAEASPDLQAALDKLAALPLSVDTQNATPALARPELKLTEAVLAGTSSALVAEETPSEAPPSETIEAAAPEKVADKLAPQGKDSGSPGKDADNSSRPPSDPKTAEPRPTASVADRQPEPAAALPQQPQARVDLAAAPRLVQAGYQTSQQQLNLPQLAFELVRQVNDGNTRFQIRLDPAELGKIDVRVDIDASGQVNARLTVEKAETLDLMQRDQRGLERALQQAGLDGAKTNLEFSLKQNPFSGQNSQDHQGGGRDQWPFGAQGTHGAQTDDAPPPTVNLYRGALSASGVNILA